MDKKSGSIIQALNMEQSSPQLTPKTPHGRVASTEDSVPQPSGVVNIEDQIRRVDPEYDALSQEDQHAYRQVQEQALSEAQ